MGYLKKAYEISVWKDYNENNSFVEKRVAIIGSDKMESPSRAQAPKLTKKVSGEKEFSFKLYSQYIDPITGENIQNPFVDFLDNEAKVKLKYREKWYDFIIKDVQEDSSTKTKTYTATDQFIIELSKNGYDLELDSSLMNNTGNLTELGSVILKETGWNVRVEGENPKQYLVEQLVEFQYKNNTVYAFFSSCKDQPIRFQYVTNLGVINSENIYDNPSQTFLDMKGKSYTTDQEAIKYGFSYPVGFTFVKITEHRANRIVYTHKSKLNPALNRIVYQYNNGTVEGYTVTNYITPNLITNLITNNTFKSTSGWTGSYMTMDESLNNKGVEYNAEVKTVALDESGQELIDVLKNGQFFEKDVYTPSLFVGLKKSESVLVNSGFYDNRNIIKNLAPGQHFVLYYKEKLGEYDFVAKIGVGSYSINTGHYSPLDEDDTFIVFDSKDSIYFSEDGYRYIRGTVKSSYNIQDEKNYKKLKTQMFLTGEEGATYLFEDFQIFSYVENNGRPMLPQDSATEAKEVNTYYYYNIAENPQNPSASGYRSLEQEYKYTAKTDVPSTIYIPVYTDDKILSIEVKQSNYFNAIQTLCETFEVWADFEIEHDEEGKVLSKTVVFKKSLEKLNYVGFRYGTNLKSSKRSIDSKAIVTKLIVPDNTNEFAKNGFCSITRAGANTSGESFILDFSYYYNFGKLDKEAMHQLFYRPKESYDTDDLQGYYFQLSEINTKLTSYIDRYAALAAPLMQAEADKQIAESGRDAAEEKYVELAESFQSLAGYEHINIYVENDPSETQRRLNQVENNDTLNGYLIEISEYYSAWQKYNSEVARTTEQYQAYKDLNDSLLENINLEKNKKEELNKKFYRRFYRFIQEGTWKDDKYVDDEKYYSEAVSVAANSALPKVTYTFNVIDIGQLSEFEWFQFELGDKTWVEDPDLFGEGREEVVITEITYELEEPDKSSIKIQNHKDQFSSLFQKVTATTQSVQYAAGAWNKAADFAGANPVDQAAFLQGALSDAETKLKNAGDQSVEWDKTGITVTDMLSPNEQIRIIGGAIMLRNPDGDGLGWKTAITARGINANVITTGQLNTGNIIIMRGDEPYFRWDAFGITAYHFNSLEATDGGYLYGLDTNKGVRFDRFGIYGYNGKDGTVWHPKALEDVIENSSFALTWDGLYLNLGHLGQGRYNLGYDHKTKTYYENLNIQHFTRTKLGRAGEYIYNNWYNGNPSYNKIDEIKGAETFVKVFSIADGENNEQLAIYDDGTLVANNVKLTGGVQWTPEASPARSIYGTSDLMNYPAPNGWLYSEIPETDPGESQTNFRYRWHKKKSKDDVLYCHTDTAGAIWEGPFLLTGRSIEKTLTQYSIQQESVSSESIPNSQWKNEIPVEINLGSYLHVRTWDVYNSGESSNYRYSVSYTGEDAVSCYVESSLGNLFATDQTGTVDLTAVILSGSKELDPNGNRFEYRWYKNNKKIENAATKVITLQISELLDTNVYFEAIEI